MSQLARYEVTVRITAEYSVVVESANAEDAAYAGQLKAQGECNGEAIDSHVVETVCLPTGEQSSAVVSDGQQ